MNDVTVRVVVSTLRTYAAWCDDVERTKSVMFLSRMADDLGKVAVLLERALDDVPTSDDGTERSER